MHQLRYDLPLFSPRNASPLRDNICSIFPLQETNVTMLHICSSLKTIKSRKIKWMDNHVAWQWVFNIFLPSLYLVIYMIYLPVTELNFESCFRFEIMSFLWSEWTHKWKSKSNQDDLFWEVSGSRDSTKLLTLVTLFCDNKHNQLYLSFSSVNV